MIKRSKRVLVAPLNWGLGHATRCIPIIHSLLHRNCQVVLASDGASFDLLNAEFPELKKYKITGYNPHYVANGSFFWALVRQLPQFTRAIKREREEISRIVDMEGIDLILSDNRYGARSHKVPSVMITHQLNLMMPRRLRWLSKPVNGYHRWMIKKFTYCWIPDNEQMQLTGELAYPGSMTSARFIGPLSRLRKVALNSDPTYDIVAVLSGPEPQRTLFEELVIRQLSTSGLNCLVIRGIITDEHVRKFNGVEVVNYLGSERLNEVLNNARVVLARSGYSTLMDLAKLEKKAILVPTPGQTEQEYLASYTMGNKIAFSVEQAEFNLHKALKELDKVTGYTYNNMDEKKLNLALDELLD
jgi:uncharacterized protein (TIGR00661 family)